MLLPLIFQVESDRFLHCHPTRKLHIFTLAREPESLFNLGCGLLCPLPTTGLCALEEGFPVLPPVEPFGAAESFPEFGGGFRAVCGVRV
jgi:hypothetical protein